MRLDADVLAIFKAGGKGWQTRINQVLRDYVKMQCRSKWPMRSAKCWENALTGERFLCNVKRRHVQQYNVRCLRWIHPLEYRNAID